MFEPLPAKFNFAEAERRVLQFWEQHEVFAKSLDLRRDAERFVFYEGPPTANGMPHPGHCLTRAIKDLFPRYKTMRGYLVERKAGWDTHGLPVEIEVCKELGIHSKEEIEQFGVDKFVQRCIQSVFRYVREWEEMTDRLGFWINLDEAYVTYHQSYVESVWWSLKTLFERGLLYQGHKVVWWWAQGGTALSAGEVGEGYRTVEDPSVYIRFPLVSEPEAQAREGTKARRHEGTKGEGEAPAEPPHASLPPGAKVSLLVWTTTPWTLISNHFAAVHPLFDYALVHDKTTGEHLYIAVELVDEVAGKVEHSFEVISTCRGKELIGLRYVPPFDCYYEKLVLPGPHGWAAQPLDPNAPPRQPVPMKDATALLKNAGEAHVGWRVLPAEFVTLDTGSGIVHQAPAFGEVDFELLHGERCRFANEDKDIPLLNAVAPDGTFTDEAPERYRGRFIFDCDKEIMRELKDRHILYHQELYRHEYPFCPRAEDDKLIQYARKSWFVRTSQFKEEFLKNNDGIYWLPEHIRAGRFGDFLRNNVDWAVSRERYWGTPLPIWVCEKTGKMEAIGSYAELLAKPGVQGTELWESAKKENPELPEHLKVHKPYIDEITYDSPFAESEPGAQATGQKPRMRRVPEVIDCWWDAGSMPFAQWGFPHVEGSVETFAQRFPCDFISEAIDQTRGWFYGLLAISTLLFSDAALKEDYEAMERLRESLDLDSGELTAEKVAKVMEHIASSPFHRAFAPSGSLELPEGTQAQEMYAEIARSLNEMRAGVERTLPEGVKAECSTFVITGDYPMPYKSCIVLGHVMGEDGLKMSKRTKNYKEPGYIFDHYGADAMRWYFFSAQTPWTSVRFQEAAIRDAHREFLVRLYNVFSFFNIYANIDGFAIEGAGNREQGTGWRPVKERAEIDRWITSELHRTVRFVREAMDRLENFPAAGRLNDFVDALSNWYVRRSRERFWRPLHSKGGTGVSPVKGSTGQRPVPHPQDQDKWDAYNTLYEALVTLSKLIAPFMPFFAETMYWNLVRHEGTQAPSHEKPRASARADSPAPLSVHLCDYPEPDEALIDEKLAQEMDLVRQVVSTGRAARTAARLKVRQPLAQVEIILGWRDYEERLKAHIGLIAEELNVKSVEFTHEADHYVHYRVKPNFKKIGPKFGKLAPKVAAALDQLPHPAAARRTLLSEDELSISVGDQTLTLTREDVDIRLEAKEGWSAAQGKAGVVVVSTELTDELREEGLMRELIHRVQGLRKRQDLAYEARVTLHVQGPDDFLDIVRRYTDTVSGECLADRIEFAAPPTGEPHAAKIADWAVKLAVVQK